MSLERTGTANGQVTLRQAVLDHRHVRPGDKISAVLSPSGKVEIRSVSVGDTLGDLRGMLHRRGRRAASVEDMQEAVEHGAAREYRRGAGEDC